ncbi:rCG54399 [Rattus norvegicus]|uniref:RCG54399 n=1 Tax=Rattus norvegicus TaxID=10116 RepID=A6JAC9_RAT|nr:rCG54399 [Rattus norvegicus]
MCKCGRPGLLFCFSTGISYTTQCLKNRGLKKLKLHPGWPKRFHVSRRQQRGLRSSGTPTPSGTAGPGSP